MLTSREMIQAARIAGLRNALVDDHSFSAQTRTRALYIGEMPDPQTEEMVLSLSLFFGDAGATPIDAMVNLVLRYDPRMDLHMLEIQPEDGDASEELLAYARELGLANPSEALAMDEHRARLLGHRMIAETRRTYVALAHEFA
ncbi:hypothetical protein EDM68_00340 [Candidatus Uhrbacteria bacterium]|nr:MAG: hypothetical protein EDM68_00340 [Candidatus Uhrbacteria bacterium]